MSKDFFCNDCHVSFKRKQNLDHHLTTEKHLNRTSSNKLYVCYGCQKSFLYSSGLSKHRKQCTEHKAVSSEICKLHARHQQEKDALVQENENMKKQIAELKEKVEAAPKTVNNNHIENQTNIQMNFYGHENLDYFHDSFIRELIQTPNDCIPRIVNNIHFHPGHPENHNIKITNRKLPYASVYKDNKWELVQKRKTIEELMEKGYDLIDDRQKNINDLSDRNIERFQKFQEKYKNDDDQFKRIYQATELCVLNGSN